MTTTTTARSAAPATPLDTLTTWGFEDLQAVVAVDSSSDEKSETIPSTEGQRKLSAALAGHFEALGFSSTMDAAANLIVRIPASAGCEGKPTLALMVHMDTAHGTQPRAHLDVVPRWDGGRVRYPANNRLHVDAEAYPMLRAFVGDDLVHGPGDFPFGLDDKLGMAELMTLGRLLAKEPGLRHGELLLVFRPDEEIGRMAAVEGLARELARRGVRFGYTVDGLAPFEVNVENFDAARARVRIPGRPLALDEARTHRRALTLGVVGVNTHGATAKSEGYLNSTMIFLRALSSLRDDRAVLPVSFQTDGLLECNAAIGLVLCATDERGLDVLEDTVLAAFERAIGAARRRGADVRVQDKQPAAPSTTFDDAALRLLRLLERFVQQPHPMPLLAEESAGREGYSNVHRAVRDGDALVVDVRLRDFSKAALAERAAHIARVATELELVVEAAPQYINMGPALARFPDVPQLAERAATAAGVAAVRQPIRGGTGVDPFLAQGIPVANLGTGYFAPESEKELTSKQNIARHVVWLAHLVQLAAEEQR